MHELFGVSRKRMKPFSLILVFCFLFSLLIGPGVVVGTDDELSTRLDGADRFETTAEIALEAYEETENVVIAEGFEFADGLAGSVLAAELEGPILLTRSDELPEATAEAIEELEAQKATILGGEVAVGAEVADELKEELELEVERLAGANRIETAVEVAEALEDVGEKAYIVSGWAPADSLAIASQAAKEGTPILQVREDEVPDATASALEDLGIEDITIVGGDAVVSADVGDELEEDYSVERIAGANRFKTSTKVAEEYFEEPETLLFANGRDGLADALAGGYFGALNEAPVLYVEDQDIGDVEDYFDDVLTHNTKVFILGGTAVVSAGVEDAIESKVEEARDIEITAVEATSENVLDEEEDQYLGFEAETGYAPLTEKDLDVLEEVGYEVEFQATRDVLDDGDGSEESSNNTGLVYSDGSIENFSYKVVITHDDLDDVESDLVEVNVLDGDDWASVEEATIALDGDVDVSVVVVDEANTTLVPTYAVQNDGEVLEPDYDADEWHLDDWECEEGNPQVDSVKSSNVGVLTVSKDADPGSEITLSGISEGEATVTVTLLNEYEVEYDVEVKEGDREPTTATADDVSFSDVDESETTDVTVKDQYDDPMKDETIYVVSPLNEDEDDTLFTQESEETNAQGIAEDVDIEANDVDETGTYTMNLSTVDPDGTTNWEDAKDAAIGSFEVEYTVAGDPVDDFDLQVVEGPEDGVIDGYDDEKDEIQLRFVQFDADGNVAEIAEEEGTNDNELKIEDTDYDVEVTGDLDSIDGDGSDVVTDDNGVGIITITAEEDETGTVTVAVKEGAVTKASFEIEIIDTTPEAVELEMVEDAEIEVEEGENVNIDISDQDHDLEDLIKVLGDEDFTLKHNDENEYFVVANEADDKDIASVKVNEGTNNLEVSAPTGEGIQIDADSNTAGEDASIIFQLRSDDDGTGDIIDTLVFPVTITN